MKRNYIFESTEKLPFFFDSSIKKIVKNYQTSLLIASHFILDLLKSKSFYLNVKEYECKNLGPCITFEAQNKTENITFSIENDILIIYWQNQIFSYKLNFNAEYLYANLFSYETIYKDKIIKETIQMHVLILEIKLKNKKYLFNLPFDLENFIDASYFQIINKDTNIEDLKKIYKDYFFLNQTSYEKSLNSTVAIFAIDENGKETLIDELFLINGQIIKYFLSTKVDNIQIKITGTKEENNIEIGNYRGQKNLEIAEAIQYLYKYSNYLLAKDRDRYNNHSKIRYIK